MAYSRFQAAILVRVAALAASLVVLAWMVGHTRWYVTIALLTTLTVAQVMLLTHFAARSGREVARFLDAIAFDDTAVSFAALTREPDFAELGAAMTRVIDQLHTGRVAREEQWQYLQTLVAHVPVALIVVDEQGRVQLLNTAARRLFETACTTVSQFARHGAAFAAGLEGLRPGESTVLRMERSAGAIQLKAAATGVTLARARHSLISLQNIETELSAHELAAWQAVIRVMAHEVTNSLTPISSLAATARGLVAEALDGTPADDPRRAALCDADEALETLARRSEGLLHFVQNHRRLTRRLEVRIEVVRLSRVFARLQRLLAAELEARQIALTLEVDPPTLELAADCQLLDQALINLMRNAIEALRDQAEGRITLSGHHDDGGRVLIAVADNGPGIPQHQREKVFIPFFTTKRQGSGVGLTLVRQIAAAHGASVSIVDPPTGGAMVRLRF